MLYLTVEDRGRADGIARALVEQRLVACVNILGPIRSLYWWKGKMESGDEVALIAKTRRALVRKACAEVKRLHGYDCPCVVALPIQGGHPPFLQWIDDETRPRP